MNKMSSLLLTVVAAIIAIGLLVLASTVGWTSLRHWRSARPHPIWPTSWCRATARHHASAL